MSGVYIPGMKMPKELTTILFHVNPEDGTVEIIPSLRYHEKYGDEKQKLPVIPVPPHGRLIDADVLFDFILNIYKTAQGDARKAYCDVLDTIVAVGDVIPADKEGEG